MKAPVYNQEGKQIDEIVLPDAVFGVAFSKDLVHQVAVSQLANQRQASAHTKDRSEVSGGGRKPWRQKGTGRARHGSTRSPIWKGGGVTFGPRAEKGYEKNIPVPMRRKALCMVLSEKARRDKLVVLDSLRLEKPNTKLFASLFLRLPCAGKKALLALPAMDSAILLSARNYANAQAMQAKDLNPADLLRFPYLVLPKESIDIIVKTFTAKK